MNNCVIPNSLCMVFKDRVEILTGDKINKEIVGAKAYGLSTIPSVWTLPFFVISSEMYEMYISIQNIETLEMAWYARIIEAMRIIHFDFSQNIFLRSNMCTEELSERGQFESYECSIDELFETIKIYFKKIRNKQEIIKVPLLLQQYSQIMGKGHISNEKRISKEHRDWKGEIEQISWDGKSILLDDTFTIPFRNWRRKVIIKENDIFPLICSSLDNISQVLEIPCAWATNQHLRIHFEWVFNGRNVYIVQADKEQDYGINPMEIAKSSHNSVKNNFSPIILHVLSAEDEEIYSQYSKILNPLIYNKLGLKTIPIYLLEDKNELQILLNGKVSEQLSDDLNNLATNPLVIRVDVNTDDHSLKQMLPRTDDIRNKNEAISWLIRKSRELNDKHNGKLPFIFIFHNFIPAFSSAFAYAEPKNRQVLVESLWGVPEGLYYYTHDKHIIDTKQQEFNNLARSEISVTKKINAKNNFIFPSVDGKWKYSSVSTDYIWKSAIPNLTWLKEIAINTRKISEYIGTGVSVMWFIGLDAKVYGCNVFPWYHEKYTYKDVPKQANRKKYWNESRFTISRNTDFENLRQITQSGNKENIKYLTFRPVEAGMIRNKDVIDEIGKIAKELNAVIILEGGVLSHAYYQLKKTGAAVEVSSSFESTVSNMDYDKLVRDKIPEKIKSGGEIAVTKKLSEDELFEQLRIKLIEEAFEVLEAENIDSLIQELADVLEAIDSIIDKKKLHRDSVNMAKIRKKEKIGGFDEGIVLQKTALPVYKAVSEINKSSSRKEDQTVSWVDKKEKIDHKEIIKRLKIPVSLKQWYTQLTAKGLKKRPDIHVTIKGKRVNANLQIEISITEELVQLTLFEN